MRMSSKKSVDEMREWCEDKGGNFTSHRPNVDAMCDFNTETPDSELVPGEMSVHLFDNKVQTIMVNDDGFAVMGGPNEDVEIEYDSQLKAKDKRTGEVVWEAHTLNQG